MRDDSVQEGPDSNASTRKNPAASKADDISVAATSQPRDQPSEQPNHALEDSGSLDLSSDDTHKEETTPSS